MAIRLEIKINTWPPTTSCYFMSEDTQSTLYQAASFRVLRTVSVSDLSFCVYAF